MNNSVCCQRITPRNNPRSKKRFPKQRNAFKSSRTLPQTSAASLKTQGSTPRSTNSPARYSISSSKGSRSENARNAIHAAQLRKPQRQKKQSNRAVSFGTARFGNKKTNQYDLPQSVPMGSPHKSAPCFLLSSETKEISISGQDRLAEHFAYAFVYHKIGS